MFFTFFSISYLAQPYKTRGSEVYTANPLVFLETPLLTRVCERQLFFEGRISPGER
jgi:hypothetical protein